MTTVSEFGIVDFNSAVIHSDAEIGGVVIEPVLLMMIDDLVNKEKISKAYGN